MENEYEKTLTELSVGDLLWVMSVAQVIQQVIGCRPERAIEIALEKLDARRQVGQESDDESAQGDGDRSEGHDHLKQ